jgi:predicted ATP-grasp superfamily ATP-dependent carboligase
MRKPLRSAGGQLVSRWTGQFAESTDDTGDARGWYYQERIAGIPVAAVFVAADGEAAILGVTRQLLGGNWLAAIESVDKEGEDDAPFNPESAAGDRGMSGSQQLDESPFRYIGSVGPVLISEGQFRTFQQIGNVLARACGLTGLFGVDAILNQQNIWPVEINPRYTASIEVLERASALRTRGRRPRRLNSIEWHEAACLFRQLPAPLGQSDEVTSGKLIHYARRDGIFSSAAARFAVERNLSLAQPAVADIPAVGTVIRRGQPVLTLLADGPTTSSVCDQLTTAALSLEAVLLAAAS